MKPCTSCEVPKPLSEFYKRSRTGYYYSECKDCDKKHRLERKQASKKAIKPHYPEPIKRELTAWERLGEDCRPDWTRLNSTQPR